jgi:hypothetical protein
MTNSKVPDDLHPALHSSYRMLHAAFPSGVPKHLYAAVLALLKEEMSFRNVAEVMQYLTSNSSTIIYNDVCGIGSDLIPTDNERHEALTALKAHGFDEWLREAE